MSAMSPVPACPTTPTRGTTKGTQTNIRAPGKAPRRGPASWNKELTSRKKMKVADRTGHTVGHAVHGVFACVKLLGTSPYRGILCK